MSLPFHTCCVCGHRWQSMEKETSEGIIKAAKVNGTGPYCNVCHHLEMAARYSEHRKIGLVRAVQDFMTRRKA